MQNIKKQILKVLLFQSDQLKCKFCINCIHILQKIIKSDFFFISQPFTMLRPVAQLAVVPTFSNVFKDDNFNNHYGLNRSLHYSGGMDRSTLTHVKKL